MKKYPSPSDITEMKVRGFDRHYKETAEEQGKTLAHC